MKTRVSSTCTIWTGSDELRIRARLLPPLPTFLAAFIFGVGCFIVSRDGAFIGTAMLGILAAGCFCLAISAYNLSAAGNALRTWISVGPIRNSSSEISTDHLAEVIAYSKRAVGGNLTHHYLKVQGIDKRKMPEDLLDCWRAADAASSATALIAWLKAHRPPEARIGLNTDRLKMKS